MVIHMKAILLSALLLLNACASNEALSGQITIASNLEGDWELYVVDVEKGTASRFTENRAYDSGAVWSPDGQSVVYTTEFLAGEIREVRRPTEDGALIAIVEEITSDRELLITTADGSRVWLTDNATPDQDPAWSPDGDQIAFVGETTGDIEIHVMDADGSNVRQLTSSEGVDWTPEWSPDGSQIAFAGKPGDSWEVFVMDVDGSSVRQLTTATGNNFEPTWSPDGRHLAFATDRLGQLEVFVMRADGTEQKRIAWSGIPSDWTDFD